MIDEKALREAGRKVSRMLNEQEGAAFHIAEAAVSTYLGALEGQVLVPKTATDAMADAGVTLIYERGGALHVWDVYAAMIAARPQNEGE